MTSRMRGHGGEVRQNLPGPGASGYGEPVGKRRRGLGNLGKLAWQKSAPALLLLPNRAAFGAGELSGLCGVPAKTLTSWEAEFPEIVPARNRSGHRNYTRTQAERVLRIKHLVNEMGDAPLGTVRQRLDQPLPLPMPFLTSGLGGEAEAEAESESIEPRLALTPASRLSVEAVAYLRDGLSAILSFCNEPPEPEPQKKGEAGVPCTKAEDASLKKPPPGR